MILTMKDQKGIAKTWLDFFEKIPKATTPNNLTGF